eukprot:COSAG06_NODE_2215_length_7325_cov_5.038887_7_plen_108_part_00
MSFILEQGPHIISEAAYQFMCLFICDSMRDLIRPLTEQVAERFRGWGSNHGGGGGKGAQKPKCPYTARPIGGPGNFWYWQALEEHKLGKEGGVDTVRESKCRFCASY